MKTKRPKKVSKVSKQNSSIFFYLESFCWVARQLPLPYTGQYNWRKFAVFFCPLLVSHFVVASHFQRPTFFVFRLYLGWKDKINNYSSLDSNLECLEFLGVVKWGFLLVEKTELIRYSRTFSTFKSLFFPLFPAFWIFKI